MSSSSTSVKSHSSDLGHEPDLNLNHECLPRTTPFNNLTCPS
jgi:hypothetical protein